MEKDNIRNHCTKCNHKWTTTDENLALWVTMHFWCDKCKENIKFTRYEPKEAKKLITGLRKPTPAELERYFPN